MKMAKWQSANHDLQICKFATSSFWTPRTNMAKRISKLKKARCASREFTRIRNGLTEDEKNPTKWRGNCYEAVLRFITHHDGNLVLVHGEIFSFTYGGGWIGHAWIENDVAVVDLCNSPQVFSNAAYYGIVTGQAVAEIYPFGGGGYGIGKRQLRAVGRKQNDEGHLKPWTRATRSGRPKHYTAAIRASDGPPTLPRFKILGFAEG